MTKYEVTPARYQGKKLQNWLKDTESSRWKLNLLKPYNICVNKTFEVLGKVRVKLQRLL